MYVYKGSKHIFLFDFGVILKPNSKWHAISKLDLVSARKYSNNEHITTEISSGMRVLQANFECEIRVNKRTNDRS